MKSICFFSSYFNNSEIPYYVKYYIEELKNYFTELVFITNEKTLNNSEIEYLNKLNIELMMVSNEGFDFGMWLKAMQKYEVNSYERVGLINDSAVLFKSLKPTFDWVNSSNLDYAGIVQSKRIAFHVQSYFVIINKNAIQHVRDYFLENGIVEDYKKVIRVYEIGLSEYLKNKNLKVGAKYFSKYSVEVFNPSFNEIADFIEGGIPLIKKKIIFARYRRGEFLGLFRMNFNIDNKYYIGLISQKKENTIDFNLVFNGFKSQSKFDIFLYNTWHIIYKVASKSRLLTFVFHQLIFLKRRLKGDTNRDILHVSKPDSSAE